MAPDSDLDPKLSAAVDEAGLGLVVTSGTAPSTHVYVSAGAASLLGYARADLERLDSARYLPAGVISDTFDGFRDVALIKRDGSPVCVSPSCVPMAKTCLCSGTYPPLRARGLVRTSSGSWMLPLTAWL